MGNHVIIAGPLGLGTGELVVIFLVLLLLFGGTKLPQLGSSLGSAIRNFKKGFAGEEDKPTDAAGQMNASNSVNAADKAKDSTKA